MKNNSKEKLFSLLILSGILLYFLFALYGLLFNFSWVDESKYLIKGYLMASGKISLYNTPSFPYQHMPLINLWFGLGQIIAGPSLLAARIQGIITGLAVLFLAYKLSFALRGKKAAVITLLLLCLSLNTALHYSTATPQAIVAFFLLLAFLTLFKALRKNSSFYFILTSFLFTITFLLRENFLPTLLIYFCFLIIILPKKPLLIFLNIFLSSALISLVFFPCLPGIIKILANLPGLNLVFASPAEREVLNLHWYVTNFTPFLKLKALYQLIRLYQIFFIAAFFLLIFYAHQARVTKEKLQKAYFNCIKPKAPDFGWGMRRSPTEGGIAIAGGPSNGPATFDSGEGGKPRTLVRWERHNEKKGKAVFISLSFMMAVILITFGAHLWAAFKLSPRAIIPYFDYIYPLGTVIVGVLSSEVWEKLSVSQFKSIFISLLIVVVIFSLNPNLSPLFQMPTKKPALLQISQAAETLSKVIKPEHKVFFLGETIPLYLAKQETYWPLYNGLNLFKPETDTGIIKKYGFWNEELASGWLEQSDLVIITKSQLERLNKEKPLSGLKAVLEKNLQESFYLKDVIEDYPYDNSLFIYEKKTANLAANLPLGWRPIIN